jgi:hypothetical protein
MQLEVEYDYVGIVEQMLKYHLISGIPAYFFVFLLVLAALSRRYASDGTSQATLLQVLAAQFVVDVAV